MKKTADWTDQLPSGFLSGSLYKELLYFGSNNRLKPGDKLNPKAGKEYGIYLTPNHKYARMYGSNLYRVVVNIKRPLYVKDKSEISPRDLTSKDIINLAKKGYDCIVSMSSSGKDIKKAHEVVLFHPSQMHIISASI